MDEATFEEITREALELLPREFRRHMANVRVTVQDHPTPHQLRSVGLGPGQALLGLYRGVPLTQRGGLPPLMPDEIFLFRVPLTRLCATPEALREQIRRTVLHEIAHFFGISDDRLRELDAY
jgi:predicted Zn-dependent protease with MMP-like domain